MVLNKVNELIDSYWKIMPLDKGELFDIILDSNVYLGKKIIKDELLLKRYMYT